MSWRESLHLAKQIESLRRRYDLRILICTLGDVSGTTNGNTYGLPMVDCLYK